ncbi:uncharacterized protein C8A04DRAFT_15322 [Dichotomopilus funicola]|uniref:Uncharacterized protein n=1 Tax=Dichotomopilus funicola TaxID=1934379 RepID=A0AAN6UY72_9PEZI|nr:hypothetical protein C8A04DRAFT_15322 [Dichotomopilus funicola]
MRSSVQFLLFFLLSLVSGLALHRRQAPPQFSMVDFTGKAACHSILTACRVDGDCCSELKCDVFDGEGLCVPAG